MEGIKLDFVRMISLSLCQRGDNAEKESQMMSVFATESIAYIRLCQRLTDVSRNVEYATMQ